MHQESGEGVLLVSLDAEVPPEGIHQVVDAGGAVHGEGPVGVGDDVLVDLVALVPDLSDEGLEDVL